MQNPRQIAAIGVFLTVWPAWAQTPSFQTLSLKDAVQVAVAKNKSIEAAHAASDAAQSRITQAKSGYLPKVNYSESWTRSDNPVFVFSSLLTQRQFGAQNFAIAPLNRPDFLNNFQSQINADQPLYDAGKTRRAVQSAQLSKDAVSEETRRTQLDVIAAVVRSYYAAQLSAEMLRAAEQAMLSAESDLFRAQARVKAGVTTDVDVLSIKVHIANIKEQQIRLQADLEVAHAALNEAMGQSLDNPHMLITALSAVALPANMVTQFESDGVSNRPETKQLKLMASIAETQAADARSHWLPQVGLHSAFEADRQRFYNGGGANWLVSIGLRWNLFDGFAGASRVQEAQSAIRRANAEKDRADAAIRLQVRKAFTDLRAAQQRIETAQATVAEAEETLRISQDRYAAGLSTITDLLRTETALLETRTRNLAAIHDQHLAAVMLEWAAGTLNAESEVLR
ncbi:MAG: TolC family protein [Bryobacteraceae bacterium]